MTKPLIIQYKGQERKLDLTLDFFFVMEEEFGVDILKMLVVGQSKGKNGKKTVGINADGISSKTFIQMLYSLLAEEGETFSDFRKGFNLFELPAIIKELIGYIEENFDIKKL